MDEPHDASLRDRPGRPHGVVSFAVTEPRERIKDPLPLSPRQLEVVQTVTRLPNNRLAADELYISLPTLKNHLENVYDKLGVNSLRETLYVLWLEDLWAKGHGDGGL